MERHTLHTDGGDTRASRLWIISSLILVLLLCCAGPAFAQTAAHFSYVQSTVADPDAPLPAMDLPFGVAADTNGNVYVSDSANNRVLLETFQAVTGVKRMSYNELRTIPNPPTPPQVTVNHIPVVTDYGVINQTTGLNMVYVASAPQKGQYSITFATGAYLFNAADAGTSVAITYAYTDASNGYYTQSIVMGSLTSPLRGLTLDAAGNLYISAFGNRVTYVPAPFNQGSKTVIFGLGTSSAIAVDGSGYMYVADANASNHCVLRYPPASLLPPGSGAGTYYQASCTTPGLGSIVAKTGLITPTGVAVDSIGNVYVADQGSNRVLKEALQADGSYVESVIADNTAATNAGLSGPTGVAVDPFGNVYIADTNNNRVVKEVPAGMSYTQTLVTNAVQGPTGLTIDSSGVLYIADNLNNRVLKLQTANVNFGSMAIPQTSTPQRLFFTFDSTGTLAPTPFNVFTLGTTNQDFKAGVQPGNVCAANHTYNTGDVCTVDVTFTPSAAGLRSGAVVLYGSTKAPIATAYVYGSGLGPQVVFTPVLPQGQTPVSGPALAKPGAVALDTGGNTYIADTNNNRVLKSGALVSAASVSVPSGIALDAAGNIYVADTGNNRVVKETLQSDGTYVQAVIADNPTFGLLGPVGIAVDKVGGVYIADTGNSRVVKETPSGGAYTQRVIADNTSAGLLTPEGVAVDGNGNVYIADTSNSRLLKETLSGTTYAQSVITDSTYGLVGPTGLAVDSSSVVYVADTGNNRVVKESPQSGGSYVQTVIATNPMNGLSGPLGVAVAKTGDIYIVDSSNNRVLKENYSTAPSLAFASTGVGSVSSDSPRIVTLLNIGNQTLNFTIPGSGTNPSLPPSSFVLDSSSASACPVTTNTSASPGTLAAGTSCTLAVDFEPIAASGGGGAMTVQDNNLNASTSQSISLSGTGIKGTPTVTLSSSQGSSAYTQSVILTAAISTTVSNSTIPVPTGTITFLDNNNPIAECSSAVTIANGQATCTTTSLSVGTHVIKASYSGDVRYNVVSNTFTQTVNQATPVITVTGPASITYGNSGTLTYSLNPSTGDTGAVSFTASGGGCTVNGTTVSIADMSLPCTLKASVAGDSNYVFVDSPAYTVTLKKASPTITVAGPGSVTYGTPGTATATVVTSTGLVADSGAVTFSAGSSTGCTVSGTAINVTNTSGTCSLIATVATDVNYATAASAAFPVAMVPAQLIVKADDKSRVFAAINPTFTGTAQAAVNGDALTVSATTSATPGSPVGAYSIVPAVTGTNVSNYAVTLVNGTLTITQATPTVALTASSNSLPPGQSVTLSATVPADATGTVTFMDGASTLGTGTVSGWTATFSTNALAVGTHSITAMYSGDKNYVGASSAAFTVSVTKAASPLVTLTSSASPSMLGQTITLTAAVPSGATGTVAFQDNGVAINGCGAVAITGAAAGCTTSALVLGAHSITAVYSGDVSNAPATSATLVLTVSDFAIAAAQSKQQTSSGASVSYPINLTSVGGTFTNAVTLAVTGLPAGATASFSPATVTPGTGGMTSILTITVPKQVAGGWINKAMRAPFALAMLFFPLQFLMTGARKRRLLLLGMLVLGLTAGLVSCGGSSNKSTSPQQQPSPQSYVLTVTGTSGALSHSTTVTMTVQ